MTTPPNKPRSQIDLLKSLGGRMKLASELMAATGGGEAAPQPPPPKRRRGSPLHEMLPDAERIENAAGTYTHITRGAELTGGRSPEGYRCPVSPFIEGLAPGAMLDAMAVLARDAAWRDLDPADILYIDTETTSLAAASGTYPFLIGLGRIRGGRMEVRQYFMDDLHEEEAVIDAVEREMATARALVSYNGRTFDMPLLEARWRMHRRRPAFPALHLDLLHPARRLWRARLPDCRLGTLEREILGIVRYSDAASGLIPAIYFDYLKGYGSERLLPVVDHHAQDILSLAAVAAAMTRVLAGDDARFDHASDHWGASGILERAGEPEESLRRLELAILAARDEAVGFSLAMHLARRFVRAGRTQDAVDIWNARLPQVDEGRIDPLVELSRHAERRLRDRPAALEHARRALELIESPKAQGRYTARRLETLRAESRRRVERLSR